MCRVTFLHPDLGIGGAERLIVDAALGLKMKGHTVSIVTTHHDPRRCFEETANGELSVIVVGDWIPRSLFNRFYALMAYIRMIYAALFVIFSSLRPEVVICDIVAVAVPVLKIRIAHVIFYCHYPDQLLSQPGGALKAAYRLPLDYMEEMSIKRASRVLVNSRFTASIFSKTFKRIKVAPDILYPSLNNYFFDSVESKSLPPAVEEKLTRNDIVFLSINRFERKKNLVLAIDSFFKLRGMLGGGKWGDVKLIIAGGYDSRVSENVEYFMELIKYVGRLGLNEKVLLLKSPSDVEKVSLLKLCLCLLYTPSNEHFGIVPIEAMYLRKPVIAVNNGGPLESVVNNQTGFLCEPNASSFANAMSKILLDHNLALRFGQAGRERVLKTFSFDEFSTKLNKVVLTMVTNKK